ncbi:MAG: 3-keto-5-aminohexanoate cleavage protein, partial [Candidatus Scalindua sp. SCAELEC01]
MPKVIISCAITGSIHTPTMSPYLPLTPDQIAAGAIGAAEAGAAILHLHARNPEDGSPTPDVDIFRQFLPQIKDAADAVINITTGGAATMSIEQRIAGPLALQPEMCSLNMGSMNFGLFPAVNKFSQWKYDWEVPYLDGSRERIFRNTFTDIETILERLGKGCGTRFDENPYAYQVFCKVVVTRHSWMTNKCQDARLLPSDFVNYALEYV